MDGAILKLILIRNFYLWQRFGWEQVNAEFVVGELIFSPS